MFVLSCLRMCLLVQAHPVYPSARSLLKTCGVVDIRLIPQIIKATGANHSCLLGQCSCSSLCPKPASTPFSEPFLPAELCLAILPSAGSLLDLHPDPTLQLPASARFLSLQQGPPVVPGVTPAPAPPPRLRRVVAYVDEATALPGTEIRRFVDSSMRLVDDLAGEQPALYDAVVCVDVIQLLMYPEWLAAEVRGCVSV